MRQSTENVRMPCASAFHLGKLLVSTVPARLAAWEVPLLRRGAKDASRPRQPPRRQHDEHVQANAWRRGQGCTEGWPRQRFV